MKVCVGCGGLCEDWEENIHSGCLDNLRKEYDDLVELIANAIEIWNEKKTHKRNKTRQFLPKRRA